MNAIVEEIAVLIHPICRVDRQTEATLDQAIRADRERVGIPTAYTLNFTINEETGPVEKVSFTWDSNIACCGEITALEKFVATVEGPLSE